MHSRAAANIGHWQRIRRFFRKQLRVVCVIPDALLIMASRASLGLKPKQLYHHPRKRRDYPGVLDGDEHMGGAGRELGMSPTSSDSTNP